MFNMMDVLSTGISASQHQVGSQCEDFITHIQSFSVCFFALKKAEWLH